MTTQNAVPGDELLGFLELLASKAPTSRIEQWAERLRQEHDDPETVKRIDRANELARLVVNTSPSSPRREEGMAALVETARDLTRPREIDPLLRLVVKRARLLLNLDMAWLALRDSADDHYSVRAADGHISTLTVGLQLPEHEELGERARRHSVPSWSADYLTDARFTHSEEVAEMIRAEGLCSVLAVPLVDENADLGTLYVAARTEHVFRGEEITLMASLGELVSVAVERTRLLETTRNELDALRQNTSDAVHYSRVAHKLHDTHSRLLDLVLRGCGLRTLLREAARELGGTLLLRDNLGNKLCASGRIPEIEDVEHRWISADVSDGEAPFQPLRRIWSCPVSAGQEQLGTLLMRRERQPGEHELRLLSLFAQSVSILLLIQRGTAFAEGQLREELFEDLLNCSWLTPEQYAERARRLSIDLNEPHTVVIARPEGKGLGRAAGWASSYTARRSGLKNVRGDQLVLLLPGSDAAAEGRAVFEELSGLLDHPVTVGAAGPFSGTAALLDTYREAVRCLDALTALGNTGQSAAADELGFLGMLLSDNHDVDSFIRSAIGPVLEYDAAQSTELVRTLQAYLHSGNSPTNAAEALYVHPNTVSRRLERVTTLLGPGWQRPDQLLEIQLALRLHRARHTLRQNDDRVLLTGRSGRSAQ
ncbi:hypothetical protein CDG81_16895 [Actinopolyspora erythraea]|uniref:GAF domain-containing protein n=1 Tax=Actinopolyspora erythraea TaxID=414996 RepID=A0A223RUZ9_9ACTN|nr:helix-turn-helix domain-containing protein [Actinopolyspora erythraea]ASU79667.1 hypothetical protein CDG81_16895 [Actinopolyspora erythraea]